jgi:hypothetical protein
MMPNSLYDRDDIAGGVLTSRKQFQYAPAHRIPENVERVHPPPR